MERESEIVKAAVKRRKSERRRKGKERVDIKEKNRNT